MRALRLLSALVCATLLLTLCPTVHAGQPAAGEATLWQYVHPEARIIIGVDWQRVKSSPTGKMFARQLADQGAKFKSSGAGFQMLDQFDRLIISGSDLNASGPEKPGSIVIAIEGKLDRALMKKSMPAGTAVEKFKGADLLVPPRSKSSDMLMAVLNERFGLMGDRDSIAKVLDAPGGAQDATLLQRANDFASRCEIWMVTSSMGTKVGEGSSPAMKQLEDIESMDLGVSLQKGLGLRANLIAKTEDAAKGFATLAQLMTSMATQDPKQSPEISNLIRSLRVTMEGTAVHMSVDIPLAQLERGVMQAKASAQEMGKKSLESLLGIAPSGQLPPGLRPAVKGVKEVTVQGQTVTLPAPPPQPEPPKTRTIRIVGLSDGPKEITYTTGGKGN